MGLSNSKGFTALGDSGSKYLLINFEVYVIVSVVAWLTTLVFSAP